MFYGSEYTVCHNKVSKYIGVRNIYCRRCTITRRCNVGVSFSGKLKKREEDISSMCPENKITSGAIFRTMRWGTGRFDGGGLVMPLSYFLYGTAVYGDVINFTG